MKNKKIHFLGVLTSIFSVLPSLTIVWFFDVEVAADWFVFLATFSFILLSDFGQSQFLLSRPNKSKFYFDKVAPFVTSVSFVLLGSLLVFYLSSNTNLLSVLFFLFGSYLRFHSNMFCSSLTADGHIIKEKLVKLITNFTFFMILILGTLLLDFTGLEFISFAWFLSSISIIYFDTKIFTNYQSYAFNKKAIKLLNTSKSLLIVFSGLSGYLIFYASIHYLKIFDFPPESIIYYGLFLQGLNLLLQYSYVIYSIYANQLKNVTARNEYFYYSVFFSISSFFVTLVALMFFIPIISSHKEIEEIGIEIMVTMSLIVAVELYQVAIVRSLIAMAYFNFVSINILSGTIILSTFLLVQDFFATLVSILFAQFIMLGFVNHKKNKVYN